MTRLAAVNPDQAQGQIKTLLDAVHGKFGMVPNLMRTLANSAAALNAFLSMNAALAEGSLDPKLRTEIALAVSQMNDCNYCLSAHTALGTLGGVSEAELKSCRQATSGNVKFDAALKFAKTVLAQQGDVSDKAVATVKEAGFSDGDIAEIVAHVAMSIFTNYFNKVAKTEIDFPLVAAKEPVSV